MNARPVYVVLLSLLLLGGCAGLGGSDNATPDATSPPETAEPTIAVAATAVASGAATAPDATAAPTEPTVVPTS
ncbi:MAG TPA: hypothetical protein PKA95_18225, partial [Thermomicrobiales bacterium]|nr:hypothetical protein [Thermomicrobiales bacterium]